MLVKNNKPCVTYIENEFLFPGINEIKNIEILKSKAFTDAVKAGQLELIGENATPISVNKAPAILKREAEKVVSINTMNLIAAKKVVTSIFNKSELVKLQETDQRKGVQDAIVAQIAIIDAAAKDEAKEE
jgi:uncharacterized protein with HEPN domain